MGERESLYVIYRPLPATLITLVLATIGAFAGLVLGTAAGVAFEQRNPGPGVWETANSVTLDGMIVANPYPMLLPEDGSAGVLLVGIGKVGPPEGVTSLVGGCASVTGYPLERDDMRMLEVQSAESMNRSTQFGRRSVQELGEHMFVGEILDSKCYLGAMKPGDGLGHRACAILCIRGGIPPMLSWQDDSGRSRYALVIGPDGSRMSVTHLESVGMNTIFRGVLRARDGWLWIELADLVSDAAPHRRPDGGTNDAARNRSHERPNHIDPSKPLRLGVRGDHTRTSRSDHFATNSGTPLRCRMTLASLQQCKGCL